MNPTKKLAGILLALVMCMGMIVPVLAESGTSATQKGTITITNPNKDQIYTVYRMFELESFNTEKPAYAYKITNDWRNFISEGGAGADYFTVDGQDYVTLKDGVSIENDSDDAAALAKAALAYAKENIQPAADSQKTAGEGDTELVFDNLDLGYYLVDSSLGSLCGLTTTKPTVDVEEKNDVPTIDKMVQEDSQTAAAGEGWGKSNTAQIGDIVNFKSVVHAKKGAQNYVVHDTMSEGLTLQEDTIAVAGAAKDTDYTVRVNVPHYKKNAAGSTTDEIDYTCTFEITFKQEYLDKIKTDTDITITYSALLNEKAVTDDAGNTNRTMLDYGDKSVTGWDQTVTKTFEFDVIKTDSTFELLNGAKFELYDSKTGGSKIPLVKIGEGTYRVAADEEMTAGFTSAVIEAGKATVKGLDADTYYLEETKQPDGYNKLAERVEVKIENQNLTTNMTGTTWNSANGGIQITNNTGTELPSTGGIGTTIFYIAGGVLLVGAGVLLVVRKRMSMTKESDK